MSIPKFKLAKNLSDLPDPLPVEALDENFDGVEAYLRDIVHSELEGLHKLVAELTAEVQRLKEPLA